MDDETIDISLLVTITVPRNAYEDSGTDAESDVKRAIYQGVGPITTPDAVFVRTWALTTPGRTNLG